jgi:hypothetical protein
MGGADYSDLESIFATQEIKALEENGLFYDALLQAAASFSHIFQGIDPHSTRVCCVQTAEEGPLEFLKRFEREARDGISDGVKIQNFKENSAGTLRNFLNFSDPQSWRATVTLARKAADMVQSTDAASGGIFSVTPTPATTAASSSNDQKKACSFWAGGYCKMGLKCTHSHLVENYGSNSGKAKANEQLFNRGLAARDATRASGTPKKEEG